MRSNITVPPAARRALTDLFTGQPVPRDGPHHTGFMAGKDAAVAGVLEALRAEQMADDGLLSHLGPSEMHAIGSIIAGVDHHLSGLIGVGIDGKPLSEGDSPA